MTLADTLRRGRLARARAIGPKPSPEPPKPVSPPAAPPASTEAAGPDPTLRDWIGVLAMVTGLFMAIMDV